VANAIVTATRGSVRRCNLHSGARGGAGRSPRAPRHFVQSESTWWVFPKGKSCNLRMDFLVELYLVTVILLLTAEMKTHGAGR